METSKSTTTTEVKDLSICSYLYATQLVQFVGKKKLPNGTVVLQFSPKAKAEELINLYWNLKAPTIQPKELFNAQRDVKDLIFGL